MTNDELFDGSDFNLIDNEISLLRKMLMARDDEIEHLRLALENCRLLAARSRKEDWALLILGFCAEGGVAGSITR